jgi:hypothetical protein
MKTTVDGPAKSCITKKGWGRNPINNGMFTTYQLVQDLAAIHRSSLYHKPWNSATYLRQLNAIDWGPHPVYCWLNPM